MSDEKPDQFPLHAVGCPECEKSKQEAAELRQALDCMRIDLMNALTQVTGQAREIKRLKGVIEDRRKSHPNLEVARELFAYWQEQCNHPDAEFGPTRQKALLARLETSPPKKIAKAILGAAVDAYVDPKGKRHDDIELICRNEVKLEDFVGRYERAPKEKKQ